MKKLLLLSLIFSIASPSFAATLDDINMAKQPAYRLGISDVPEKEYIEAKESRVEKIAKEYVRKDEGQIDISELTYADLSIKQMSKEIEIGRAHV